MNTSINTIALSAAALALAASGASAAIAFDQNVTPDVIFGDGNTNGSYTTDRANNVELGFRGKLRFNALNQPENTFNSNGDGTYTFNPGNASPGFGFAPNNPITPEWNFEWSINSDLDGTSGRNLADLTYEISFDNDPSAATNFTTFDPIHAFNAAAGGVQWDHSLGDNSTGNGDGVEVSNGSPNAALYDSRINALNVAQNSWNPLFFSGAGGPFENFDPNQPGVYTFQLAAFDVAGEIARTSIDIIVVPAPSALALFAGAGCLITRRRRRN